MPQGAAYSATQRSSWRITKSITHAHSGLQTPLVYILTYYRLKEVNHWSTCQKCWLAHKYVTKSEGHSKCNNRKHVPSTLLSSSSGDLKLFSSRASSYILQIFEGRKKNQLYKRMNDFFPPFLGFCCRWVAHTKLSICLPPFQASLVFILNCCTAPLFPFSFSMKGLRVKLRTVHYWAIVFPRNTEQVPGMLFKQYNFLPEHWGKKISSKRVIT